MQKLVIIGAGGLARELRWLAADITAAGPAGTGYAFVGYAISDPSRLGPYDSADEIRGDFSWLADNREQWDCLIVGIGNPDFRRQVATELEQDFGFGPERWATMVHPAALHDAGSCRLDHGVALFGGTVGTVNLVLGPHSLVHYGCTVGHESVLGRGTVLNPGANLSGGVSVGEGVLVGTGAQVLQYLKIGSGAVIGAGAVVTKDVPPGAVMVGVPARAR